MFPFVYLRGALIEAGKARVSVEERGFRFGDGVFETIRVQSGVPWQWDWHMERLTRGLQAIRIPFEASGLNMPCRMLLRRNGARDCLLRIYISRGKGGSGYLPDIDREGACVLIELFPLPEPKGVRLHLSRYTRLSPSSLPTHAKLAQGMNSALARMEAEENGCNEALLLDGKGHIAEASAANIFWLREGVWHTPSLSTGALEGSVRAAVLRLMPEVQEGLYGIGALEEADAVLLTNAARLAQPVMGIAPLGWEYGSAEAAAEWNALLRRDIAHDIKDYAPFWI